ncbi:MAG: hypothetical protein WCL14_06395 [Bacteroidota bacterium]
MTQKKQLLFSLALVLIMFFFLSEKTTAQNTNKIHCYFHNHGSVDYYVKILDEYKMKENVQCYTNMMDSLLMWTSSDSIEKSIRIFDNILKHTEGIYAEQSDKVLDFLMEIYFADFFRYLMANKTCTLGILFEDKYGYSIFDAKDKKTEKEKFYAEFDPKIEKSTMSPEEKEKAKKYLRSYHFSRD